MAKSEYWNRHWRQRASRRRFLGAGAAAGVGAAGLALVGCGDDDDDDDGDPTATAADGDPTATTADGDPTATPDDSGMMGNPGGIARYPFMGMSSGDPPTLFPFENLTYLSQHPSTMHYSRLLRGVAGEGIAASDFATALDGDIAQGLPEQVDEVTYVFKMKDNVTFHDKPPMDGRKATAQDFVDTYEAFIQLSQNAAAYESVIDSVEATDESTIKITLVDVYAPFLTTHASSPEGVWFIPVDTIVNDQVQSDPVGTGPFVFKEWETGVAIRWDRHPNYHDAPLPYFDGVEGSLVRDPQRILAGLQAGELDWSALSGAVFDDAQTKVDPAGQNHFSPTGVLGAFYFNFDIEPWGDKRVRQALSMAFSRDDLLDVLDQTGQGNWQSHLAPALAPFFLDPADEAKFGENSKYFRKNVPEVKALLEAATGSDTLDVKVTANVDRYGAAAKQAWELLQSLVADAGINVELNFQEYGAYIGSTYLGDMTEGIGLGPLIGSPRDPNDIFSRNFESSSARNNWGGTPIPEMADLDAAFAKQRVILDLEERIEFIHDLQRDMAESMIAVPYHGAAGYSYTQPWVQGYHHKIGYGVHRASYAESYFTDERIAQDA